MVVSDIIFRIETGEVEAFNRVPRGRNRYKSRNGIGKAQRGGYPKVAVRKMLRCVKRVLICAESGSDLPTETVRDLKA